MAKDRPSSLLSPVKSIGVGSMLIGGAILLLLGSLIFIATSYLLEKSVDIQDVRITNITGSSATVSWVTNEPVRGSIIYSGEDKWTPILTYKGKLRAYEDRDIKEVEYAEYELERWGEYYVHHVTLKNLRPNSKYYYRVSTGFKSVEFDYPALETLDIIAEPYTPDPVYGMVLDIKDNTSKPTDGVVYYRLVNDSTSMWYSETLNSEGRWSGDLGGILRGDGELFDRADESVKIELDIKTNLGNGSYEFSLEDYQPLPYMYVGEGAGDESGIKPLYDVQSIPDLNTSVFNKSVLGVVSAQVKCGGFANPGEYHCNTTECLDYLCLPDGSWQGTGSRGMCNLHPDCDDHLTPDAPQRCGGFANPGEWHCNTSPGNCQQYQCDPNGSGNWLSPNGRGVCDNHPDCGGSTPKPKPPAPPVPPVDEGDIPPGGGEIDPGTGVTQATCEAHTGESALPVYYGVRYFFDLPRGQWSASGTITSFNLKDQTKVIECTFACTQTGEWLVNNCHAAEQAAICPAGDYTFSTTGCTGTVTLERLVSPSIVQRQLGNCECSFRCNEQGEWELDTALPCRFIIPDQGQTPASAQPGGTGCVPPSGIALSFEGNNYVISAINCPAGKVYNVGTTCVFQSPDVGPFANAPEGAIAQYLDCEGTCSADGSWLVRAPSCYVVYVYPAPGADASSRLNGGIISKIDAAEGSVNEVTRSGVYEVNGKEIEIIVPEGEDKILVQFFEDKNSNGVKDDSEDILDSTEIQLTKTQDILSYDLTYDWNLISFPMALEDAKTAKGLLEKIAQDGGYATHVATYNSGRWQMYSKRGDWEFSDDFNIVPGAAYFVKVHKTTRLDVRGRKLEESMPLSLSNGWNLVGVVSPGTEYTADSLVNKLTTDEITADTVTRWNSGRYENYVKTEGVAYGNDFTIFEKGGYFIRVKSGAKVFTP